MFRSYQRRKQAVQQAKQKYLAPPSSMRNATHVQQKKKLFMPTMKEANANERRKFHAVEELYHPQSGHVQRKFYNPLDQMFQSIVIDTDNNLSNAYNIRWNIKKNDSGYDHLMCNVLMSRTMNNNPFVFHSFWVDLALYGLPQNTTRIFNNQVVFELAKELNKLYEPENRDRQQALSQQPVQQPVNAPRNSFLQPVLPPVVPRYSVADAAPGMHMAGPASAAGAQAEASNLNIKQFVRQKMWGIKDEYIIMTKQELEKLTPEFLNNFGARVSQIMETAKLYFRMHPLQESSVEPWWKRRAFIALQLYEKAEELITLCVDRIDEMNHVDLETAIEHIEKAFHHKYLAFTDIIYFFQKLINPGYQFFPD